MRKPVLALWSVFTVFLFLMSCQVKPSVDQLSFAITEKKFRSSWIMLTERNGELVRFAPCDASTPEVVLKKDSLQINWGQEEALYKLLSVKPFRDKLLLTAKNEPYETEETFIVEYVNDEKRLVRWYVWLNDTTSAIFTDAMFANRYPLVKQPCAECWGYYLCDDGQFADSLVMSKLMVGYDF